MPAKSGRKKAPEWGEVDISENDMQNAACIYCNQIISAKIDRVRNHIQKYPKRKAHDREKPDLWECLPETGIFPPLPRIQ